MKKWFALFLLLSPVVYADQIYKYTDQSGVVNYSNIYMPGATVINLGPSVKRGMRRRARPINTVMSGLQYPVISRATQQRRDNTRRQILMHELAHEQEALVSTKKSLGELQQSNLPNLVQVSQQMKNAVSDHERNIVALQDELRQTP